MSNDEKLAAGAIAAWKNNLERADKLFSGLDAQALEKELSPGRNRLIYLWGHLTATNDRMLSLLGIAERIHPEFDEIFLSSPDRSAELPPVGVVSEWWTEVNTKLNDGIAKFTPEDWLEKHTAVSEADFAKEPLRNRFAILLNRTNHLAYHLGQTAFVPK